MCVTVFVISKHNSKFVDYQTCNRWLSTSEATRGSPTANSDCKITQVGEMKKINIYHIYYELCMMLKNFWHWSIFSRDMWSPTANSDCKMTQIGEMKTICVEILCWRTFGRTWSELMVFNWYVLTNHLNPTCSFSSLWKVFSSATSNVWRFCPTTW